MTERMIHEAGPMAVLPGPIVGNWRLILVRGLAAIAFGVLCFGWPAISLLALVLLFAVYALVDGISTVAWGMRARWWSMVVVGAVSMLGGLVALFWPAITALALLYVIAAWAIVHGVFEIVAAIYLRRRIQNEWLLGFSGVVSILFGVLLAVFPGAGALALLWAIGAFAVIFGALAVALALRLRTLERQMRVRPEEEELVGAGAGERTRDEHLR